MYSDACTGQNRNFKMTLSCLKLVLDPALQVEIIDHIFMVSGHSCLPNDSDFGSVKPHAKGKAIYTRTDRNEIIVHSRRKKPFTVIQMKQDEFLSTDALGKEVSHRRTMSQIFQYFGYKFNGCNTENLKPTRYYTKQH